MTDLTQKPIKGAGTTFWSLREGEELLIKQDYLSDDKWDRLAQIKEFTPSEITVSDEEDNYLDDQHADWVRTIPGQKTASATTLTLAWKPGELAQQKLIASLKNDEEKIYRAKYPNGAVDVFKGYINSLGKPTTIQNVITRTVGIMPVGKPTLAEEIISDDFDV